MDTPTELMAEKLRWFLDSWSSLEFKTHTDYKFSGSLSKVENPYVNSDELFIVTKENQIYKKFSAITKTSGRTSHEFYSDGHRFATILYSKTDPTKQTRAEIGDADRQGMLAKVSNWPFPFELYFVKKVALTEALKAARYEGVKNKANSDCYEFTFEEGKTAYPNQELHYYLSTNDGSLLAVEAFDKNQKPTWTWSRTSSISIKGIVFPETSVRKMFDPDNSIRGEYTVSLTDIKLNNNYRPDVFQPKIQAGVVINDMLKKQHYKQPGLAAPGQRGSGPGGVNAIGKTEQGDFIQAEESGSYLPLVMGLLTAILLVFAGSILYFRRKKEKHKNG